MLYHALHTDTCCICNDSPSSLHRHISFREKRSVRETTDPMIPSMTDGVERLLTKRGSDVETTKKIAVVAPSGRYTTAIRAYSCYIREKLAALTRQEPYHVKSRRARGYLKKRAHYYLHKYRTSRLREVEKVFGRYFTVFIGHYRGNPRMKGGTARLLSATCVKHLQERG
jgi:hypothetical protein